MTSSNPPHPADALEASLRQRYEKYVMPTYGRFPTVFSHGSGSYLYDFRGKQYLDMGAGIAVCCLGHAHPEITRAIERQAGRLIHVSNLYHFEHQSQLAETLVKELAPGKMFFCNSGAEANEALYKLARRVGHEEGRFEILTFQQSFHGRTMAGIAATGQAKIKNGFGPEMQGFKHVPYGDLEAVRNAISPSTIAILLEGIQGEGGIHPARPEFLLGLREICRENRLLLLWDGIQCGYYRTGRFQSFQRILENVASEAEFFPDAISMAKSMANGVPMGGIWASEEYANVLSPGSHGTTFGGNPLSSVVARTVLGIIRRDELAQHARTLGDQIHTQLSTYQHAYPHLIRGVRGLGLMLGIEWNAEFQAFQGSQSPASLQMTHRLMEKGLITIPSGMAVTRLLPPLNLSSQEADQGLTIIQNTLKELCP